MATVVLNDPPLKITVVAPGGAKIGIIELASASFFERLKTCKATANIKTLKMEQDGQDPEIYHYTITLQDGRVWSQTIRIPGGGESEHTFNVPDPWKISEFVSGRDIRDSLETLVRQYGMTKCECEW